MISELINALSAGQQLSNSTGWKNAQATTSALVAIMGATLALLSLVGIHPQITTDQLVAIAGGIAGVLGVCNSYTTIATTKTLGLPPGDDNGTFGGKPDQTSAMG